MQDVSVFLPMQPIRIEKQEAEGPVCEAQSVTSMSSRLVNTWPCRHYAKGSAKSAPLSQCVQPWEEHQERDDTSPGCVGQAVPSQWVENRANGSGCPEARKSILGASFPGSKHRKDSIVSSSNQENSTNMRLWEQVQWCEVKSQAKLKGVNRMRHVEHWLIIV